MQLTLIACFVCLACSTLVAAKPPRECPPCVDVLSRRPVCAQRCGQLITCTFASSCEARRMWCTHRQSWKVLHGGICRTESPKCRLLSNSN